MACLSTQDSHSSTLLHAPTFSLLLYNSNLEIRWGSCMGGFGLQLRICQGFLVLVSHYQVHPTIYLSNKKSIHRGSYYRNYVQTWSHQRMYMHAYIYAEYKHREFWEFPLIKLLPSGVVENKLMCWRKPSSYDLGLEKVVILYILHYQ